jgi:hypothetical protein
MGYWRLGIPQRTGKVCFYSIGNFMTTRSPKNSLNTYDRNLIWLPIEAECLPPNCRYFSRHIAA